MKLTIFLLAVTLPLVAWSDEAPKPAKHDGTWLPVSATVGDMPLPEAVLKMMSLTLKGNAYLVKVGAAVDKGTVKLLPGGEGKMQAMDITGTDGPNKGKTIPAIVRQKGDTLTVCYGSAKRPTKFDTAGQPGWFLVVYKRQKEPRKKD